MFPYNEDENAWISKTYRLPNKYTIRIKSKVRTLQKDYSILFSLLTALTTAILSTTIPPLIYFFTL